MDLIYTNKQKIDQGVLNTYSLDLSYGAEENNFQMILGKSEPTLEYGAFIYIEGTEYGGIIDAKKASSNDETIIHMGRTWHGMLNSKVIEPDDGEDYLIVSGDANDILATLIERMNLADLFISVTTSSNINISNYQFDRYCKGYDGIKKMLLSVNAKLKISWSNRMVQISAVTITDYSKSPVDDDVAILTAEQHEKKVNHLICLGRGELANREVIHLYVDQFGQIIDTPYYTGLDEIVDVYDNNNAESSDELRTEGIKRLEELRDNDKSEISIIENNDIIYDIGDIVGASIISSGISASSTVSQKIIKINNGVIHTEYQVGG